MSKETHGNRPAKSMRDAAQSIVEKLHAHGHEALFAGGCVRDMLMGREASDYDVVTSATPGDVMKLFKRTQKIGAKFGVVLARVGRHAVEVATFRRDAGYADGRHPTSVEFTNAREDAIRRDFTINGMFFDPIKNEVVDYVEGRTDIERRVIRAIGEPARRFEEDHLRLLRAVRFAARFEFQIESATWQAMQQHAAEIARISPERIREELEAILTDSHRARGFANLCDCNLMAHLCPGSSEVLTHRLSIEAHLAALRPAASFELALAVLLLPLPMDRIGAISNALRCSNFTKRTVSWLHRKQNELADSKKLSLADLKLLMAHPAFAELLALYEAGLRGRSASISSFDDISQRIGAIRPEDVTPPPLLTGEYLARLGLAPGPNYKTILERVYYQQLNNEITTPTQAEEVARRLLIETRAYSKERQ